MWRWLWLWVALAGCQHEATAVGRPEGRLVSVEVFDTDPETRARVESRHGAALQRVLAAGTQDEANRLAAEVRADGDYAYVDAGIVTYFASQKGYLTLDLVTRRDAASRMPFRPPPSGRYDDPGGLLAAWRAYEAEATRLAWQRQLRPPPADCPAFHCLGDPRQPELAPLAVPFAAVPAHADALVQILRDDADVERRAHASFLLAYLPDGDRVVTEMVGATGDASSLVRNNAMRVLSEIARLHPDVDVPVEPVIAALRFPSTTDRNKAAATLHGLATRPDGRKYHDQIAGEAGAVLLAMLELAQPNNHDYAYKILTAISGERFGERDYAAWRAWLRAQPLQQ